MRRKCKIILVLAIAVAMLVISAVPASADRNNGWYNYKGTYYYMKDGTPVKGWQKIDGSWYYFDEFMGAIQTGWVKYGGNYYYFSPTTGKLQTGWVKDGGKYYYCSPATGALQTGWVKDGKNWYYLSPKTGTVHTGWLLYDGNYYYFSPTTGALVTGWLKLEKDWYYFSKTTGVLEKGYAYVSVEEDWWYEEPITVPMWKYIIECTDCEDHPLFEGIGETYDEAESNAIGEWEIHKHTTHDEVGNHRFVDAYEFDMETGEYETVDVEGWGYYEEWILVDGKMIAV